ncbi:hypothetical protein ACN28S_04070 [Cystobacter fuscus]
MPEMYFPCSSTPFSSETNVLRVISHETCTRATTTVDEYIPLDLCFCQPEPVDKLYWRARDGDTSLLEVGIAPDSGALVSLTLTAISPRRVRRGSLVPAATCPSEEGVPVVDRSPWLERRSSFAERFLDEELKLELAISEACAVVTLGTEWSLGRFWSAGNVRFGVDDLGLLRAIEVGGLSSHQIALLAELASG